MQRNILNICPQNALGKRELPCTAGVAETAFVIERTPVEHARGGRVLDLSSCWGQSHGAEQTSIQVRDTGCLPLSCLLKNCTYVKMHVATKTLFVLSRQDAALLQGVLHWHAADSITGMTSHISLLCWGDMDGTVPDCTSSTSG